MQVKRRKFLRPATRPAPALQPVASGIREDELLSDRRFDLLVCVAPKDYGKLRYGVRTVLENVPGIDGVYVVSPTEIGDHGIEHPKVVTLRDRDVLDFDMYRFKYRSGWIYQQFLKLFQGVTEHDWYLTVDADLIVNKRMPVFTDGGRPIWYSGWDQNHAPYFQFQEKVFGFGKVCDRTFICDMNFFHKRLVAEMLSAHSFTVGSFLERSAEIITPTCYVAEPELYGSFAHRYHPGLYEMRAVRTSFDGRPISGEFDAAYTEEEIRGKIEQLRGTDLDTFSMHSWFDGIPHYQ